MVGARSKPLAQFNTRIKSHRTVDVQENALKVVNMFPSTQEPVYDPGTVAARKRMDNPMDNP